MANAGDIYLGLAGSEMLITPIGRTFKVDAIELARKERTASGKLVKDIIALKRQITLDYSYIDGDNLEIFLDMYDLESELSLIVYDSDYDAGGGTTTVSDDTVQSYTVLMQPINYQRVLVTGNGLWSGVSIVLEEV